MCALQIEASQNISKVVTATLTHIGLRFEFQAVGVQGLPRQLTWCQPRQLPGGQH